MGRRGKGVVQQSVQYPHLPQPSDCALEVLNCGCLDEIQRQWVVHSVELDRVREDEVALVRCSRRRRCTWEPGSVSAHTYNIQV